MFNFDFLQVGGMRFVRIGRLTISFSVSAAYQPFGANAAQRLAERQARAARTQRKVAKAFARGESFGRYLAAQAFRRQATQDRAHARFH